MIESAIFLICIHGFAGEEVSLYGATCRIEDVAEASRFTGRGVSTCCHGSICCRHPDSYPMIETSLMEHNSWTRKTLLNGC